MHSSKWKKPVEVLIFALLALAVNAFLNYALYPDNYSRLDIHQLVTGEYQDLFVGSSHGKCGIDPETVSAVTGKSGTNQCLGGEYPMDAYYLVREACRQGKPERVIFELDPGYFTTEPNEGPDFAILYRELPVSAVKLSYFCDKILDGDFRSTLFPWYLYRKKVLKMDEIIADKRSEAYQAYDAAKFEDDAQTYHASGFIERKEIAWDTSVMEAPFTWSEDTFYPEAETYFRRLAAYCEKEGIEFIAIVTPVPSVTEEAYSEEYEKSYAYFEELTAELGITYWNFNRMEDVEISRELSGFADYEGHMYGQTARQFSQALGELLAK